MIDPSSVREGPTKEFMLNISTAKRQNPSPSRAAQLKEAIRDNHCIERRTSTSILVVVCEECTVVF